MKQTDFRLITKEDVPEMAKLLLCRQTLECQTFPSLQNSCLSIAYITEKLTELVTNCNGIAIGVGAFENNTLIGYLIGQVKTDAMRGRHIWVPYEGIALDPVQSPELLRNLYANGSALWLEQGCFNHYALIPLGNKAYYEALLGLSFFIEHVHGIMNLKDYVPFENTIDAEIRIATEADKDLISPMYNIINRHQNSAPTFIVALPERIRAIKKGFEELAEDKDTTVLLAIDGSTALGFQEYEPCEVSLMAPDNAVDLCTAGTYPSHTGKGVGRGLMNEGYRIMKERGYHNLSVDWRISNLFSSTFWPKCGFIPVAYRMVRSIDTTISWANFSNPSIGSI